MDQPFEARAFVTVRLHSPFCSRFFHCLALNFILICPSYLNLWHLSLHSLIVHDAAEVKKGSFKLKIGGSSGQNGVKDIVKRAGSAGFPRLQLGIGRPETEGADLVQWVLGRFRSTDVDAVREMLSSSLKCALNFIERGIESASKDSNASIKVSKKSLHAPSTGTESSSLVASLLERSECALYESVPVPSESEIVVG